MINNINKVRESVKNASPLIHAITHKIAANLCANGILAVGAKPMMAEHPKETALIAASAKALLLNLGNISDIRARAMVKGAAGAKKAGVPIVFDAVGVACSPLRRKFAKKLIKKYTPRIIKGNYSEIFALYSDAYKSDGVDADASLQKECISDISAKLAKKTKSVILASGKTDIVTNGKRTVYINNGCSQLAAVTGTGCLLGALSACYISAADGFLSAVAACAVLGICGEMAQTEKGNGTFAQNLLDCLSTLTAEDIEKYIKTEEIKSEA